MPGKQRLLVRARTEVRPQEFVHKAQPRIQQRAVAGSAVISDSALQEVPNIVKLVPMLLRPRLHALRSVFLAVVGVQVAVRLLRGNDLANILLYGGANLRPP